MTTVLQPLRWREYVLIGVASIFSVVCVWLGIWQIHRLQERRAHNSIIAARLTKPPIPVIQLPRDTALAHYRRAIVHGQYDYTHELALIERTRDGSPGVYIITPVKLPNTDTAVLVNRGWVYSPDGVHTDLTKWREADSLNATGYVDLFEPKRAGISRSPSQPNAYRWLDATVLQTALPYPVLPYIIILQGDTTTPPPGIPPRVSLPPLDEGPHTNYAIQWFSFALIAIVGTILFLIRARAQPQQPSGAGRWS